MENREFLIDHHTSSSTKNPMEEDFEDHSQFKSSPTSTGGGANNNLLLDGEVETVGSGDGTFLVAEHDDHHHDDGQQPHSYGHHEESPSSMMYDNAAAEEEEEEDDDVAKHAPAVAAAAPVTGRSSQHSSSIDDFEFIATPQSTTDREVKMDNLLDFEPQPVPVATQSLPVNLVETLLTGEDLKPHTTSAGAYLENEFAQFNSGTQPPQDFNFHSASGKPVKDVYTDFMEAERGGGGMARVAPIQAATPEPPIETVSSTPIIPEPVANSKREEEKRVNYHDGGDDDLLQQFAAAPPKAMEMKPEVKKLEAEEVKPMVIENEPKHQQETPNAVPVVAELKQQPPQPEPKEVIKPKEVDAPKPPTPTPVVAATAAVAQKKQPQKKDELITTSAEEMFCKFGLDAWFKPERLHPKVESLIYWRDVKKSGIVCGAGMVILLAMSCFSVISVFAYVSLLALAGTVAFRIYKSVMQAIQKTSEGHPFKAFMDFELQLPQEKVQQVTGVAVSHINSVLAELRRLFLVEDLVDSIKFGLMLWCLTYVGAWFNGMTLVILSYVALFTLPKVYETNKQSIDAYLDLVRSKINEITEKVKAAIPIGKKVESDKEK